jgi:hypothetical protein
MITVMNVKTSNWSESCKGCAVKGQESRLDKAVRIVQGRKNKIINKQCPSHSQSHLPPHPAVLGIQLRALGMLDKHYLSCLLAFSPI